MAARTSLVLAAEAKALAQSWVVSAPPSRAVHSGAARVRVDLAIRVLPGGGSAARSTLEPRRAAASRPRARASVQVRMRTAFTVRRGRRAASRAPATATKAPPERQAPRRPAISLASSVALPTDEHGGGSALPARVPGRRDAPGTHTTRHPANGTQSLNHRAKRVLAAHLRSSSPPLQSAADPTRRSEAPSAPADASAPPSGVRASTRMALHDCGDSRGLRHLATPPLTFRRNPCYKLTYSMLGPIPSRRGEGGGPETLGQLPGDRGCGNAACDGGTMTSSETTT